MAGSSFATAVAAGSLFAIVSVAPSLVVRVAQGNEYQNRAYFDGSYRSSIIPPPEVSDALRLWVSPGDWMAIWGWMPQYLVVTHAIMGTRDSITQFQIENGPARVYYRGRYARDMRDNEPEYFLDAVAPVSFAFTERSTQGLESFPELSQLVHGSYRLVTEVDGIRLFKKNS